MQQDFWQARWDAGQTGFHQGVVNDHLRRYSDVAWTRHGTVLVPLCGKSVDLVWLATRFARVIGVEFVRRAAEEFFAEQGLTPVETDDGTATILAHDRISIRVQDVLTVTPESLGDPIDAIWDRAALVALPREVRPRYAERMVALMPPGASSLLVTLTYDEARMDGPPFSVADDEVERLFSNGARTRRLEHGPVLDRRPRGLPDDASITTSTWLITRN